MIKIALFSDIHGNLHALDAVLADIEAKGGVDHTWILGDHVANGPDPVGVMQRLLALPNAQFIRGNTDRYISSTDRPPPYAEEVTQNPALLNIYAKIHGNFGWTTGIMAQAGYLEWLKDLSFDVKTILPDGTRMLGIHSSPWDDFEDGFSPKLTEKRLHKYADACDGDLIFCGHTHWPYNRKVKGKEIVNLGSVGMPAIRSRNACWTLLTADARGYSYQQHEVSYDRAAVIQLVIEKMQPGVRFINQTYLGTYFKEWDQEK